ncbi:uncharacterized protein LOC135371405 isoform X5 [Ornithodoros turicata]|uniref:uncharacterized protein LOC135371405 isoform X5 n=1 Tax=Ornithodoros turicata TaxID=34597 RepID=UPI00313945B2
MAASGSIAIKVEPEDTSSSIFPGNHDGLEEFITDDYPSNTLFQSESTLVKEEAQDTMVSPLRGNQANGDEFINDDNQGHSGSNTARDSTQKRRKMLCPNTNPRKPCYSRRKSSKAHCRLLRKKRRLKAHATIGDSQADTLQLSDGALEESLFTRDLSMARDCTEVEGSEHRPLETPPGATTVRSAVTYIKEEPHDARHFPSHGTSGNAEVVAETVMVPSDFFCVKEEPSSPLPGNDEDIDELLMSDQTEHNPNGLLQHLKKERMSTAAVARCSLLSPVMDFTLQDEKYLISLMEMKTLLWNVQHPSYHRREIKEKAYSELAKHLGRSVTAVKSKWNNLRSQFSREQRKVKKSSRSGVGADDVYRPKWVHYKDLLFLASACKERQSKSNVTLPPGTEGTTNALSSTATQDDNMDGPCEGSEGRPAQSDESSSNGAMATVVVGNGNGGGKQQRTLDSLQAAKLDLLRAVVSNLAPSSTTDECDTFGAMMAHCVRAVPQGKHRAMAMLLAPQAVVKYSLSLNGVHTPTADIVDPIE